MNMRFDRIFISKGKWLKDRFVFKQITKIEQNVVLFCLQLRQALLPAFTAKST